MTGDRDAGAIRAFLARARTRLATIAAAQGATAGCVLLMLVVLARWSTVLSARSLALGLVALVIVGVLLRVLLAAPERRHAALVVERRLPESHNLLVTASELMADPARARTPVAPLVYRQAARQLETLDLAALFPARASWGALAASAVALTLLLALQRAPALAAPGLAAEVRASSAPSIDGVNVAVVAPAYTGRATQQLENPARIDALAGSRIRLTITATAGQVTIETLAGKGTLTRTGDHTFSGMVPADADGFIALQPSSTGGIAGTRRLIGMTVTADRAPRVRLTAPARDMMLPDANRTLDVAVEANDDLALATLRLRYTKVSGAGERFTFSEGELPLTVSRGSDTSWSAALRWSLASLALGPGDMVVYRAVATDRRPGAPAAESDSYIAEVLQPGSDAAAGFAIDPEQERYALSQQMIIVKTERLMAKRTSLATEAFANAANEIAAEQRRVRAEFIFMMGGELADTPDPDADPTVLHEENEAEGESDILDGRGANTGRIALVRAVRSMSGAATLLNTTNVDEALVSERAALVQLERAFSHTRIILRALTQQERLDLTRRMTGPLLEAGRDVQPSPTVGDNARTTGLRSTLAGVAELLGTTPIPRSASARASELAERVLRIDPSAKPLQRIAASLNDAAAAIGSARAANAAASLESATVGLTAALRGDVLAAPDRSPTFDADRLQGALNDRLRSARGTR